MRINIHAGHNPDGMTACGAVGLIRESTEARAVKDRVVAQLAAMGHTVHDCTCNNASRMCLSGLWQPVMRMMWIWM